MTFAGPGGATVNVAVTEDPYAVAVIFAGVEVATAVVVMGNVVDVVPATTVAELGGVALFEPEERVTMVPPAGAGPVKVTVPVEVNPPTTDGGERFRLAGAGGFTVTVAVSARPPSVAVIVAVTDFVTGVVVTVN